MNPLNILFENQNFLVVYKAAGMLSIPSKLGNSDPRPCLLTYLRSTYSQVLPVHRLDFEVQGLMIFARSVRTHKIFSQMFEQHLVTKTYHALTFDLEPAIKKETYWNWQTWNSNIAKGKRRSFHAPYGKEAITRARIIKEHATHKIEWQLQPMTGRTHQLRLELASRGIPILGDHRYGSNFSGDPNCIALIASHIEFTADEPATAELMDGKTSFQLTETQLSHWRQAFIDR